MKDNNVKISVVLPVYNAETYIEDCIRALLSQNYPVDQYEIIMVDNNSKDRSPEIIKRYPDIKYLKRSKQGSYAARNTGILQAKGEIIAFTDADCEPSVDWLKNIEHAFRHPEISVILGRNYFVSDSHILSMLTEYEAEKAAYVFSCDDKTMYYGYTNNMAIQN
jgi:glycosyltransferase involved in cell wall biosynthesis